MNKLLVACAIALCVSSGAIATWPFSDSDTNMAAMLQEQRAKLDKQQEKIKKLKEEKAKAKADADKFAKAFLDESKNNEAWKIIFQNNIVIPKKAAPLVNTATHYFLKKHRIADFKGFIYFKTDVAKKGGSAEFVDHLPGYDEAKGSMGKNMTEKILLEAGMNLDKPKNPKQKSLLDQGVESGIIFVIMDTVRSFLTGK